jgi:capsid assembly protease
VKNELRIQDRLSEPWAIRPQSLHSFLAMEDDRMEPMGKPQEAPYQVVNGIAVIQLAGVMMKNPDEIDCLCGATSTDAFTAAINAAAADPAVGAIVLDVDSPGGQALGVDEAHAAVVAANARKPVVAYTGGLMCSGAIWACCGAAVTYCSRMAIVGSIGCYSVLGDTSEYFKKAGIKMTLVKSGKHKGDGAYGTPVSDALIARSQNLVDQIGGMFRADVKACRPQVKDDAMEGQEFLGADAVAAGLVDSVTSYERAVADAGALAAMRKNA